MGCLGANIGLLGPPSDEAPGCRNKPGLLAFAPSPSQHPLRFLCFHFRAESWKRAASPHTSASPPKPGPCLLRSSSQGKHQPAHADVSSVAAFSPRTQLIKGATLASLRVPLTWRRRARQSSSHHRSDVAHLRLDRNVCAKYQAMTHPPGTIRAVMKLEANRPR